MNVFVASTLDEAKRDDDFSYTVAGELVWGGFAVCDCPDCGCERSMAGMASSQATTAFRVRFDPDMTRDLYRQAFRDNAIREGWIEPTNPVESSPISMPLPTNIESWPPSSSRARSCDGSKTSPGFASSDVTDNDATT